MKKIKSDGIFVYDKYENVRKGFFFDEFGDLDAEIFMWLIFGVSIIFMVIIFWLSGV